MYRSKPENSRVLRSCLEARAAAFNRDAVWTYAAATRPAMPLTIYGKLFRAAPPSHFHQQFCEHRRPIPATLAMLQCGCNSDTRPGGSAKRRKQT